MTSDAVQETLFVTMVVTFAQYITCNILLSSIVNGTKY
jgi:hypothetical protein